LNIGCGGKI